MVVAADNAIALATANDHLLPVVVIHSVVVRIAAVNAAVKLGPANLARKNYAARKKAEVDNARNNAKRAAKEEVVSAEVETEVAVTATAIEAVTVAVTVAVTAVAIVVVTAVDAVAGTIAGKYITRRTALPL